MCFENNNSYRGVPGQESSDVGCGCCHSAQPQLAVTGSCTGRINSASGVWIYHRTMRWISCRSPSATEYLFMSSVLDSFVSCACLESSRMNILYHPRALLDEPSGTPESANSPISPVEIGGRCRAELLTDHSPRKIPGNSNHHNTGPTELDGPW